MPAEGGPPAAPTGPVLHLPFESSSAREARAQLRAYLAAAEAATSLTQDAVIVLGELVSNALDHGRPRADGRLEVGFALDEVFLWVTVADGGGGSEPSLVQADTYAERGRGLAMVQALASSWAYDRADGTRVTARLALAASGGPA